MLKPFQMDPRELSSVGRDCILYAGSEVRTPDTPLLYIIMCELYHDSLKNKKYIYHEFHIKLK